MANTSVAVVTGASSGIGGELARQLAASGHPVLAVELQGTGVTVTALCPGPVATELFEVAGKGVPRKSPAHELSAAECARYGIAAARRGQVIAVPGLMNKLVAIFTPRAPRAIVRAVMGRMGLSYLGYAPGRSLPGRTA